jgi:hypothetical protein
MDLNVSVPAAHAAFLRMGVEDMSTGRVGAIEISTRGLPAPPSAPKDPEKARNHNIHKSTTNQ